MYGENGMKLSGRTHDFGDVIRHAARKSLEKVFVRILDILGEFGNNEKNRSKDQIVKQCQVYEYKAHKCESNNNPT